MATLVTFRIAGWPAQAALDELGSRVFAIARTITSLDALRISVGFFNFRGRIRAFRRGGRAARRTHARDAAAAPRPGDPGRGMTDRPDPSTLPARRSWAEVRWRQFRHAPRPVVRAVAASLSVAIVLAILYLVYDVALDRGADLPGGDLRTLAITIYVAARAHPRRADHLPRRPATDRIRHEVRRSRWRWPSVSSRPCRSPISLWWSRSRSSGRCSGDSTHRRRALSVLRG